MSDQSQYLKSSKLIATHYGEEYEHYPPALQTVSTAVEAAAMPDVAR